MKRNMHLGASPLIFSHATQLRKDQTEAEKILWTYLSGRQIEGVKFRNQHPTKKFALDFFANELKLGIELDGKQHEEKSQKFYDEDRTDILNSYDYTILRFTNEQIFNHIELVLDEIRETIIILKQKKGK